ncbi:MAG: CobW family GTP-binding protein [Oceanobacter sp.]
MSQVASLHTRTRVHMITGFLGTGKTTCILHLLKHKPEGEKWAVLVNEFGEIGVDGAMIKGSDASIAVKEVPGGCLCCVSGLPFQIGLNSLIAREKPDVLLIEPSGLGHPKQILDILKQPAYGELLSVGTTVTLMDPRHLSNSRYLEHAIWQDQISVADVLVANKADLCNSEDLDAFDALVSQQNPQRASESRPALVAVKVEQGQLSPEYLVALPSYSKPEGDVEPPRFLDLSQPLALKPGQDLLAMSNQGDGFYSLGWLIKGDWQFSADALYRWFSGLAVERAKAVLNTDQGWRIYNLREGVLSESLIESADDNRLELIDLQPLAQAELESAWQACRIS